jgi:hypothetical protein
VATIIPRIARGLQQLSSSGSGNVSWSWSTEAAPLPGFGPKSRSQPELNDAGASVRHADDKESKAQSAFQRKRSADTVDRSGAGDSSTGYGTARPLNNRVHIAAGILGGLVLVGAGIYFFRDQAPMVETASPEVSRTSATPSPQSTEPNPLAAASRDIDIRPSASVQPRDVAVAKLPQAIVESPAPPTTSKPPPRLFARGSSPALTPNAPGGGLEREASKGGGTVNIGGARQELDREKQRQIEMALRNLDESSRLMEEAALEKSEGEDPALLQQMKEERRRVEETKQKLKVTSDFEKRAQILRELEDRLSELHKIVKQLKAAPRYIKAG